MSNTETRAMLMEDLKDTVQFIAEMNDKLNQYEKDNLPLAAQATRESMQSWCKRLAMLSSLLKNEIQ